MGINQTNAINSFKGFYELKRNLILGKELIVINYISS